MKQVAIRVGVAQSTVSRILNGVEGRVPVTAATRERVREAVRELGYRPHPLARGLRGAGTSLVGLIVREIADPFFAAAIEAVTGEARRHGYQLVLGHAESQAGAVLALSEILEMRHCDGLLVLGDVAEGPRLWEELRRDSRSVVGVCQGGRSPGVPTVNVDNRRGVELVMGHLHELGHRRIAFVDAGWGGDVAERRQAYLDLVAARGLEADPAYLQAGTNAPAAGETSVHALLGLARPPTAILCATDQVAMGALAAAAARGLSVPRDLSVAGFDDIPIARYAIPALTTVRQPVHEIMGVALRLLLELVADGGTAPGVRLIDPELVVRASTGPTPATVAG
ncbi:MAG TPA: LacI family DNA-binding transcriptional regulator [Candidatus Dormibacteraeota bacterium]|jgi:DNA-binding LacI/PurR family transcriptional regulator|nr:LacI family DNA-binding transcriptional regulator [Candidatus Dormibacteraeota bacterium]